jgi:hypothetical protein
MLKWSDTQEASSDKHIQLPALRVRSADGFEVSVELAQSIKIPPEQASRMISRLGFGNPGNQAGMSGGDATLNRSIRNLIAAVGPQVDNHFRNATQSYKARDLQKQRDELCIDANQHITEALGRYGVNSVGTWINHIDLPDELEKEMKERTIKEEQAITLRIQQKAEEERRKYAESQARAESALARIHAETEAEAARIAADAQAYAARQQADVDDYALQQYISAIGGSAIYTDIQRISYLTNIRLPPLVGGGAGVLSDIFTQLLAIGQGSAQHSLPPIPRNLLEMLAVKRSDDSRLAYIKRSLPENLDMNDPDTRQFITDFLQPAAVPTCAACGAEHRPEAGFCAQCGATLAR